MSLRKSGRFVPGNTALRANRTVTMGRPEVFHATRRSDGKQLVVKKRFKGKLPGKEHVWLKVIHQLPALLAVLLFLVGSHQE